MNRSGLVLNRDSHDRLEVVFEPTELPCAVQHGLTAARALMAAVRACRSSITK